MENRAHALLAGIFTVGLLVAAVLMGVWLNRDRIERVPYEIATKLPVPGLNPQAAVRYRGLDVGKVDKIVFDSHEKGQILIQISVSKETPITHSTYAFLGYQGVTGIAFMQLDDDGSDPADVTSSKKQVARIPMRPGLLDKIQTRGLKILEQTEVLSQRLNQLLEEGNRKRMLAAFDDVSRAANKLGGIPKQIEPMVGKLTSAASSADQETLPRLNALTGELHATVRTLDRTAEQVGQNPQSLLFGPPPAKPGPGEPGFAAPSK